MATLMPEDILAPNFQIRVHARKELAIVCSGANAYDAGDADGYGSTHGRDLGADALCFAACLPLGAKSGEAHAPFRDLLFSVLECWGAELQVERCFILVLIAGLCSCWFCPWWFGGVLLFSRASLFGSYVVYFFLVAKAGAFVILACHVLLNKLIAI
jgi:hypothetical protein